MDNQLRCAIGLADACELASAAFAFPTEGLAAALAGGGFVDDARASFEDAGHAGSADRCAGLLQPLCGADSEGLFGNLRKGYSLLYLAPGGECPVWPYESPFRFMAEGREGQPSLFRSPRQIDVERHMREAGVMPETARTEPADSVWDEFSFMSYLYGNLAKALHEGRDVDAVVWSGRVVRFWDEHASKWLPDFMRKTIEEAPKHSYGIEYASLAEVGLVILEVVAADVELRRAA